MVILQKGSPRGLYTEQYHFGESISLFLQYVPYIDKMIFIKLTTVDIARLSIAENAPDRAFDLIFLFSVIFSVA